MSASDSLPAEPASAEPFRGGELTVARAAKLLGRTDAEMEAMVAAGAVESRRAPRPGGGEQVLVSLESTQAVRNAAAEAPPPSAPEPQAPARPPDPAMVLARRPGASVASVEVDQRPAVPSPDPPAASPAGTELLQLADAVDRLAARHEELLSKLDELIEVLLQTG